MLYPAELRAHTLLVERMMRIELTPSAWKAEVLPLNYIRMIGAEDEIRTRDPRLGKAMLYPSATSAHIGSLGRTLGPFSSTSTFFLT